MNDKALETPADENMFRQLRLNQWVKQSVRWMPMDKWDECGGVVDSYALEGRPCYAGLDLSSTSDLTALVLVFPPVSEDEPYKALPFFWLPEDTLSLRVRRDHVPYCLDRACFTSGENAQYRLSVRAEVAATLVAEGPGAISAPPEEYLVRRLTPLECCRLQGFPDGWTEHLETEEPGEQEIARWVGVFEDWYRAQGKTARASLGKIAKWLKNPRTDSAEYKAYGNSVAVPCVFFVLAGIAWAENRGDET